MPDEVQLNAAFQVHIPNLHLIGTRGGRIPFFGACRDLAGDEQHANEEKKKRPQSYLSLSNERLTDNDLRTICSGEND
jgi:hypothetical protein